MPDCIIIAICAVCGALIGTLVSIVAALHDISEALDREYDKLNNKHDYIVVSSRISIDLTKKTATT